MHICRHLRYQYRTDTYTSLLPLPFYHQHGANLSRVELGDGEGRCQRWCWLGGVMNPTSDSVL